MNIVVFCKYRAERREHLDFAGWYLDMYKS
jgi:hypothetical protein